MSAGSGGSSVAEVNVHSSSWLKSSEKVQIVKTPVADLLLLLLLLLLLFILHSRRLLLQKKSLLLLLLFVVMMFVAMLANILAAQK